MSKPKDWAGFDLVYKTYIETHPKVTSDDTNCRLAEAMYSMGILEGCGLLRNVKTTTGLRRRVAVVKDKMQQTIDEYESKSRIIPMGKPMHLPDLRDLIGKEVHIKFAEVEPK